MSEPQLKDDTYAILEVLREIRDALQEQRSASLFTREDAYLLVDCASESVLHREQLQTLARRILGMLPA